jgi:predicted aconitase with swiveling domain
MTRAYLRGRVIIEGIAAGEALVSKKAFTFAHGVDPATGMVTDIRSDIRGKNVKGKILVYPYGKGSTTGAAWFLETARLGNQPAAILTQSVEPLAAVGSVLARVLYKKKVPVMAVFDEDITKSLRTGTRVAVNANEGRISFEWRGT